MRFLNKTYPIFIILCFLADIEHVSSALDKPAVWQGTEVVFVLAHKAVPVDSISTEELIDIFTLQQLKWKNGELIRLMDFKRDFPVQNAFYGAMGFQRVTLKNHWLRIILSGEGQSPTLLRTEEEMIREVALTPGAIGYAGTIDEESDVKVIAIISTGDKHEIGSD